MNRAKYFIVDRAIDGFHSQVSHVLLRPIGGGAMRDVDCPRRDKPKRGVIVESATVLEWAAATASAVFGVNSCNITTSKSSETPEIGSGSSPDTPPVIGVLHRRQFFSEKPDKIGSFDRSLVGACRENRHGV